jgi:hypothetical protein
VWVVTSDKLELGGRNDCSAATAIELIEFGGLDENDPDRV